MNRADFYTRPATAVQTGPVTGSPGPNQSIVTNGGTAPTGNAAGAPFAWLGMVMALVLLYLGIRFGAKLA